MNNTNTTKNERRAAFEAEHAAEWAIKDFARGTKTVANPFNVKATGDYITLEYPTPKGTLGHHKAVYFRTVINHPEMMRVSSSNYRAEDEANGVYDVQDARNFYRALLKAGFELK